MKNLHVRKLESSKRVRDSSSTSWAKRIQVRSVSVNLERIWLYLEAKVPKETKLVTSKTSNTAPTTSVYNSFSSMLLLGEPSSSATSIITFSSTVTLCHHSCVYRLRGRGSRTFCSSILPRTPGSLLAHARLQGQEFAALALPKKELLRPLHVVIFDQSQNNGLEQLSSIFL